MPNSETNPELDKVIAQYLEQERAGRAPDRRELLDQHPDLAEDLRSFFANDDRMQQAAGSDVEERTLAPRHQAAGGLVEGLLPEGNPPNERSAPEVGTHVRYFGDYELLQEIARGGMGVVYKARQVNLNRIVALKMILAGQLAGEEDVRRFYAEAEAAANLDHPGIVPIFEVGQHDGQHYFSMGFIDGESLADKVKDGPLPPQQAAEFMRKVAEAVAFAHERGVVHRDLKPANVLIDPSGQPKVTDFGLAKKVEGDHGLTMTGQILGTPSYMPPEQASGSSGSINALADVYSLGAMLYCLLTGRPPFQAASPLDTLMLVLEQDPLPPRQLNPRLPLALETIVLKCLQKDPAKRYASARDLADDLQRFLDDEPILARPASRVEWAAKWAKKRPLAATLIVSLPALLIGDTSALATAVAFVGGMHIPLRFRFFRLVGAFLLAALIATVSIVSVAWLTVPALREGGSFAATMGFGVAISVGLNLGLFGAAICFIFDSVSQLDDPSRSRWRKGLYVFGGICVVCLVLLGMFVGLTYGREAVELANAWAVNKSKPGTATASPEKLLSSGFKFAPLALLMKFPILMVTMTVYLCIGILTGRLIRRFQVCESADWDVVRWFAIVTAVAVLVLPTLLTIPLAGAGFEFQSTILITSSMSFLLFILIPLSAWLAAFGATSARNGKVACGAASIVVALMLGLMWMSDKASRTKVPIIPAVTLRPDAQYPGVDVISRVSISNDGKRFVSTSSGNYNALGEAECDSVHVWDVATGERIHKLPTSRVHALAVSHDGAQLLVGGNSTIELWDLERGERIRAIQPGGEASYSAVAFSPDQSRALAGGSDGTVGVWEVDAGNEVIQLNARMKHVASVAYSPDGRTIAAGCGLSGVRQGYGDFVQVWNLNSGNCTHEFETMGTTIMCLTFSSDGQKLLGGSASNDVAVLWDLSARKELRRERRARTYAVRFGANDQRALFVGSNRINIWDLGLGNAAAAGLDATGSIECAALSADGRYLATGMREKKTFLWRIDDVK